MSTSTGSFKRGHSPSSALLLARGGPATKSKKIKIELKRRFFYFKQKKETRRKGTNASQLAIRNFNDITGKHMNTRRVFYFYLVLFENQKISSTFLQKTNTFSCYSTCENLAFSCTRGGSRTAATSKMDRFVIIVNGWKPLTIITKRSILDVAAVLDPPLCTAH